MENHSKKLSEFLGIIHEVDVISKTKQFIEISPLAHQNSKLLESDFLKFVTFRLSEVPYIVRQ